MRPGPVQAMPWARGGGGQGQMGSAGPGRGWTDLIQAPGAQLCTSNGARPAQRSSMPRVPGSQGRAAGRRSGEARAAGAAPPRGQGATGRDVQLRAQGQGEGDVGRPPGACGGNVDQDWRRLLQLRRARGEARPPPSQAGAEPTLASSAWDKDGAAVQCKGGALGPVESGEQTAPHAPGAAARSGCRELPDPLARSAGEGEKLPRADRPVSLAWVAGLRVEAGERAAKHEGWRWRAR